MQPCRFAWPAGWQLWTAGRPPAPPEAFLAQQQGVPSPRWPQGAIAVLSAPPTTAARSAYIAVLKPILPAGELLAQLSQGVAHDLAALSTAFAARVKGRSQLQRIELGADPAGLQAVWLDYPATAESPAYEEGRLYFLLARTAEGQERRVPLLFIGGRDALPTHLTALHELIATLTLAGVGAAVDEAPQPVHAAWSD